MSLLKCICLLVSFYVPVPFCVINISLGAHCITKSNGIIEGFSWRRQYCDKIELLLEKKDTSPEKSQKNSICLDLTDLYGQQIPSLLLVNMDTDLNRFVVCCN